MARVATTGDVLLERERELAMIEQLLEAAERGSGGVVVVSGPAGIGKSALLAAARGGARDRGMTVLAARGEEIEREFPFGVVRQLFERPARTRLAAGTLTGAAALAARPLGLSPAPESGQPDEGFAARHGLYWLAADLAAEAPLLLALDDAQWADSPSVDWLAFLAARLDELRIALITAVRDESQLDRALGKIELERVAQTVVPGELSSDAVGRMTADILGVDPQSELVEAVHRAAGGNPLWTRELARALLVDERAATSLGVAETTPASVARAVLVRLGQLGSEAVELARAVAVLGSDVELAVAASVAGLDPTDARRVAEALERAGILAPGRERLSFTHPIVRQGVYADLSLERRAAAHAVAAQALEAHGAEPEHIATHLLLIHPQSDKWVTDSLREAARLSAERGAPEPALTYLRRALLEQPDAPDADLLHELGTIEALTSDPTALEHLLAAYELADRRHKPKLAVEAAQVMLVSLRVADGLALLERALEQADPDDREGRLRLTAALFLARIFQGAVVPAPVELPRGDTPGERALLASAAISRVVLAQPAPAVLDLARSAWSEGRLLADEGPDSPYVLQAVMTQLMCDSFEEAGAWLGAVLADAKRRGSVTGFVTALATRAYLGYRRGDLGQALVDARAVLEIEAAHPATMFTPIALAFLLEALIETGELDEADAALRARGMDGPIPPLYPLDILLDRRGRLRVAQGDLERGLSDLLEARRRLEWFQNPVANLESYAALALSAVGRHEQARAFVDHELELARKTGLPRQIAIALRAAALIEQPTDQERLEQSAELAARAGARLEEARALADLGAALRRAGERAAAREPLRRALELATQSGATVLAERTREELLAAGGRPRRVMLSGSEALTPSERRIAELAAAGHSNRDIAQGLFVTVRTIEMHLSAAYRKLDIGSRRELPAALRRPDDAQGEPD